MPGGDEPERWINGLVERAGQMEVVSEEPWATVFRVPLVGERTCWFKICAPIQAFETRLTADLFGRWPDRVPDVIGHDEERSWLLLADAGTPLRELGNPPQAWLELLPDYADLQRGEAAHASEHLGSGVPDLRLRSLRERYDELLRSELPLAPGEIEAFRAGASDFEAMCDELGRFAVPETIQHDDLHMMNVYVSGATYRVLDWGDSSIAHPFFSLVETYRFLEEFNGLRPGDPWFSRLAEAYLEPWGPELRGALPLALRVGAVAHAIAWLRQRDALPPKARPDFDIWFTVVLRRALAHLSSR
jgi:Phosphotransferase enzyme family